MLHPTTKGVSISKIYNSDDLPKIHELPSKMSSGADQISNDFLEQCIFTIVKSF